MNIIQAGLGIEVKLDAIIRRLEQLEARFAEPSQAPLNRDEAVRLLQRVVDILLVEASKPLERYFIGAEDRDRDILDLLLAERYRKQVAQLVTDYPVAIDSNDHKFPAGTRNDNSRHPRFVRACEAIIGHKISHLDLGCSGGGLVWDFLSSGHFSIGIEGSDYSLVNRRAEWRTIPNHLFTADIAKPFQVCSVDGKTPIQFDIVTAWEVLEHIAEADLPVMLSRLRTH